LANWSPISSIELDKIVTDKSAQNYFTLFDLGKLGIVITDKHA